MAIDRGQVGEYGKPEVLLAALERAGVNALETQSASAPRLTKAELYALGFSGRPDSGARRAALLQKLGLPERLAPNALLDVLNALYSREQLLALLAPETPEKGE